jgi:hypothetical protein
MYIPHLQSYAGLLLGLAVLACSTQEPAEGGGAATGGAGGQPPTGSPSGGTSGTGGGQGQGKHPELFDELYAIDHVPTFELTVDPECIDEKEGTKEYCEGSLRYVPNQPGSSPTAFSSVGVRLKGWASYQSFDAKPSFKVKLDEYVPQTRLYGVRRLTLNNMAQDPSMVHEVLGYRFYRAAGVSAPLCNHARVVVNGQEYGLYANVESVDDEFVERQWQPAPGNLYDITAYHVDLLPEFSPAVGSTAFELETNRLGQDTSDLAALIEAVSGSEPSFYEAAGAVLDWEAFLTAAAAQAILADWDGYFGGTNNYKLYHELSRGKFVIFPWGIDQTFGANDINENDPTDYLDYTIDHDTSSEPPGIVLQRCLGVDVCREQYLATVRKVLAVWEELPLGSELEAMLERIAPLRAADSRRPYDAARMESFVEAVRTFVAQRGGRVRAQLETF